MYPAASATQLEADIACSQGGLTLLAVLSHIMQATRGCLCHMMTLQHTAQVGMDAHVSHHIIIIISKQPLYGGSCFQIFMPRLWLTAICPAHNPITKPLQRCRASNSSITISGVRQLHSQKHSLHCQVYSPHPTIESQIIPHSA